MEVGDYVLGFRGREEGDAGAVAVEAEVAVVGHYVDRGVPGYLGWGGGAGADVVDCADVDAGEAEAGALVEHGFVRRVGVCEGEMWLGVWFVLDCESRNIGEVVVVVVIVVVVCQRSPLYIARVRVTHPAESVFRAVADLSPDPVFAGH